MEILICNHYFPPHRGGIETVAYQHAEGLTSRGHDVTVVTSDIGGDRPECEFDILELPVINSLEDYGLPYPVPYPIAWRSTLKRLARDKSFNVAHLHGVNYLTSSVTANSIPDSIPVLLHQHTPFIDYGKVLNIVEKVNDSLQAKYLLSRSERVLAVSEKIRKYAESLPGEAETVTFPNAISVDEFTPENKSDEISNRYDRKPVFFCLTRLVYKKGVEKLIQAAKLLDSDSEIIIAGSGPDADDIRTMANYTPNVHVIGNLSEADLKKYYASATGFLFTSKTGDAFPTMSVLEAMSSGTPVITPEVDSQMNGFVDGEHGYVIPEMTAERFAERIDEIAEGSGLAEEMGRNCRENVVENFSIDQRVIELESQYHQIGCSSEPVIYNQMNI